MGSSLDPSTRLDSGFRLLVQRNQIFRQGKATPTRKYLQFLIKRLQEVCVAMVTGGVCHGYAALHPADCAANTGSDDGRQS